MAKLKQYFPLIWERNELLQEINRNASLAFRFQQWNKVQQEYFLDCCTGMKGIKILYDAFFKEIMNPEVTPERLEEFLTVIMGREVKIIQILMNDGSRIADESHLLIMDIVVRLEDGSIVNVEVQRIGYDFPGERSACYSSDLLLRQYKLVRSERGKKFHYRDIKDVYTIVFFERSIGEFHKYPATYVHYFEQKSDSGLKMDLLQKYFFIPLDICRERLQYKSIETKLEAWLTFLSADEPERIIELIEEYPEFKPLYEQIYDICRNVDGVMAMFSKELLEMDKNMIECIMDEMQEDLEKKTKKVQELNQEILETEGKLTEAEGKLTETEGKLTETEGKLTETEGKLTETKSELVETKTKLTDTQHELSEVQEKLEEKEKQYQLVLEELKSLKQKN
ncbi:MAG: PD-(D/E)XK nuclease family transposase [Lachnospiraceae bacterium]|nr:PD-(D/E)XK nuclease family transposase [Lachnospiraceae bacterium]